MVDLKMTGNAHKPGTWGERQRERETDTPAHSKEFGAAGKAIGKVNSTLVRDPIEYRKLDICLCSVEPSKC